MCYPLLALYNVYYLNIKVKCIYVYTYILFFLLAFCLVSVLFVRGMFAFCGT